MSDSSPSPAAGPTGEGLPLVGPDHVEQNLGDGYPDIIPNGSYGKLPVIGIGGSAGALPALQTFFQQMPADSGMAFVVILHLSPNHESIAAELLQRSTTIPVSQVTSRVKVEANHIYVIPPGKQLSMDDGFLTLSEMNRGRGRHVAVDFFFRTLADTRGPHAAAIVLSGADGDGSIGLKRVKERGGLAVVQDPEEAEHMGMPRTAISTGLVDWVLPVAEMPAKLIQYWRTEKRIQIPPDVDEPLARSSAGSSREQVESTLLDILGFLRVRTGHDFIYYKRATVLRRVARRMQVHALETPQAYFDFIRAHPEEVSALLRDLLISVTNFFRDRDAFTALESLVPSLFEGKGSNDTVRVWVAACATGEEAYSVAMMLTEYASKLEHPPLVQVFGTDLAEQAIRAAREGLYPEAIVADVSDERLRRFFTKEHAGYRIKRELREIVLFALHDLLKDAPFSRLDMVTCRNLLIYLNRDAQARAMEIFHFAVRPGGLLFLGTSESVDDDSPFFVSRDKKSRLYARRPGPRPGLPVLPDPGTLLRTLRRDAGPPVPAGAHMAGNFPAAGSSRTPDTWEAQPPQLWSNLHYEFLEELGPPSVLVRHDHAVIHVSRNAGQYLQVSGGHLSTSVAQLVHPALSVELRAALYRAQEIRHSVETRDLSLELAGVRKVVRVRVVPSKDEGGGYLVMFLDKGPAAASEPEVPVTTAQEADLVIRQLERDLAVARLDTRNVVELSDASNEELKAANEELQAMNEELRSAGEEMETGREELQSVNEELNTVNQELKTKVDELARSNSDLQNLMASTQIATVFLDRNLCVQRYTPPAVQLFNLIPSDLGRPLSDLSRRLNYPNLTADANRVLTEFAVVETEVVHSDERRFLGRMLPYRTTGDHIAGVVMTFVDITRLRHAERDLRESEARFRTVSNVVPDLLYSTDSDGQLLWCNQRWLAYTGQTAEQAMGYGWMETIHPDDLEQVKQGFQAAVREGHPFRSEHRLLRADGQAHWFLVRAEPLRDGQGKITRWFGAKTDIDDLRRATAACAASEERLRLLIESATEFAIFSMDMDLRVTYWNSGAERLLGYRESEILGEKGEVIFLPEDRAAGIPEEEARAARTQPLGNDERWQLRKDGSRFWASGAIMAIRGAGSQVTGYVKILRDETEHQENRVALERSKEELLTALKENDRARAQAEAATRAKDTFLAVLSHELRTPLTPVLMSLRLLSRLPDFPAGAKEHLEMIERNVAIEGHMIDDLLDVTRITHAKIEIVREPLDLHKCINDAVEISKSDIEGKEQTLTVELEAHEFTLEGDNRRLQQTFWNLLKNASKFTPEKGSIRLTSRNEAGHFIVEITDSGIGFEPEATERIFAAFTQASEIVAREFGGLGLGLAISKAAIDAHGGSLSARSDGPQKGATFIVTLPLKP